MTTNRGELELETRAYVLELSELLRRGQRWSEVRAGLASHGLVPETSLLAHLIEGEEGEEVGVLVSADLRVVRFECEPVPEDTEGRMRMVRLRDITSNDLAKAEFGNMEIEVALGMAREAATRRSTGE